MKWLFKSSRCLLEKKTSSGRPASRRNNLSLQCRGDWLCGKLCWLEPRQLASTLACR